MARTPLMNLDWWPEGCCDGAFLFDGEYRAEADFSMDKLDVAAVVMVLWELKCER